MRLFWKGVLEWTDVRPQITRLIDVASRAVISVEVTIGGISANAVLGVLRRALVAGENWEGFPTAPTPQMICIDRGTEHQGVVEEVLRDLGLKVPVGKSEPEDHPHIERAHRTLNQNVSFGAVGRTTSSRVGGTAAASERDTQRGRGQRQREVRRPDRPLMALRTLEEFLEALLRVHRAYNASHHRGLERELRAAHERSCAA